MNFSLCSTSFLIFASLMSSLVASSAITGKVLLLDFRLDWTCPGCRWRSLLRRIRRPGETSSPAPCLMTLSLQGGPHVPRVSQDDEMYLPEVRTFRHHPGFDMLWYNVQGYWDCFYFLLCGTQFVHCRPTTRSVCCQ